MNNIVHRYKLKVDSPVSWAIQQRIRHGRVAAIIPPDATPPARFNIRRQRTSTEPTVVVMEDETGMYWWPTPTAVINGMEMTKRDLPLTPKVTHTYAVDKRMIIVMRNDGAVLSCKLDKKGQVIDTTLITDYLTT